MATKYPGAEWDPLGPQTQPRMRAHDIVCVHTMAGSFVGTNAMFHQNGYGGTESHFGLAGSGRLKQWQDLDFTADANYEGSDRVVSIETADIGEGFPSWGGSDVPEWTDDQIDVLVPCIRWLCDHYKIPKQLIANTSVGQRGIAYHRQGIDGNFTGPYRGRQGVGERWSTSGGKVCPGDRRIRQLIEVVIPRVQGDVFMSDLTRDEQRELLRNTRTIVNTLADTGDIGRRSQETTIGVRNIQETLAKPVPTPKPVPAGYFAKFTTQAPGEQVVYWVAADHQLRLPMVVGSPLHEHLKKVCRDAGWPERAQVLPDAVLLGIPVIDA